MKAPLASAQRGVALLVVLATLLITCIALLGSLQAGWLGERRVGSESDTQRAFAAAEALMRDAELDILGLRADGTPCGNGVTAQPDCRTRTDIGPFFPQDDEDLEILRTRVLDGHRNCLQGICLPVTLKSLDGAWTDDLANMTSGRGDAAIAATYGQFTGAVPDKAGNPLLEAVPARAWYWVEVYRYAPAAGILSAVGDLPIPDRRHPFVYRITAYANGLRPGTRVHLRSVFVPYPQNPLP